MSIFNVFTLLGGLAFFLYGMTVMSSGLETIAGGKMEQMLRKMTSSPLKSLLLGAGITIAVQSSSAVTVMLVGLVNSGIMTLSQTICVIMGSNIGTTVTAWILSLSGITSDNFFLRLIKPESFSPVLALVGVLLTMAAKRDRTKNIGSILIGFSILMFGMELMTESMSPLADMPEFRNTLTAFKNPIVGILVGTIITAVIQSSAASVGILQALSLTGGITYTMAFPIIMGQNIGTCSSALISAIGVNTNAKRVSVVHILFNVLGTAIFMSVYYLVRAIWDIPFFEQNVNPFSIAVLHSIFNVTTALMLFPFYKLLEKIAVKIIKQNKQDKDVIIDEKLLLSPTFAIHECIALTNVMSKKVVNNFIYSTKLLKNFHQRKADDIAETEPEIDMYEDKLGSFLLKLSCRHVSDEVSNKITQLLLAISDFERIGDHSAFIAGVAQKLKDKGLRFSPEAISEIKIIVNAVTEILTTTIMCFENDDTEKAKGIEPLESVIKHNIRSAKNNHIIRLKEGKCTIDLGFLFMDLMNDLRRITAHCANIATCAIQIKAACMEKHEYNKRIKYQHNEEFQNKYRDYNSIYSIKD